MVVPAPLGPSRAKTVPSATSRSMPSSTTWPPKDLRRPVAGRGVEDVGHHWSLPWSERVVGLGGRGRRGCRRRRCGPDLGGGVAGAGLLGWVEAASHHAELGLDVEPGGRAFPDADLELARGGLQHDGAPLHVQEPDVATAVVLAVAES